MSLDKDQLGGGVKEGQDKAARRFKGVRMKRNVRMEEFRDISLWLQATTKGFARHAFLSGLFLVENHLASYNQKLF